MDNVTHSLAGLLVAEAAARLRARLAKPEPSARFHAVAAISSTIAANLPDADLIYSGFGGDHLRYMLHHRGHTHTVLVALVGGALVYGFAMIAWRWRAREPLSQQDARWLFGLLLVSTLSHLLLDWTNSYGIHPFWPVDDHWRYGDAVFIIEPWLWVVSVPALVLATSSRAARVALSLVMLAGLTLAWRVSLVSTAAAAALTAGAVLFVVLALVLRAGARTVAAAAAWIGITMLMATASRAVRAATLRAVHEANPRGEVLDVVVSPLPVNPVCQSLIAVERSALSYHVATARASALPALVDAASCGAQQGTGPMLIPSTRRSTSAIHWDGEWGAPISELATLARESCPALAALRFIRVPIWRAVGESTVLLGDVRYGGGSGSGFTDVRVPRRSVACPAAVPPWTPPRADLLSVDDR